MNGKINLRVPFILKLTFSKTKFHKIRRAPSTITKKKRTLTAGRGFFLLFLQRTLQACLSTKNKVLYLCNQLMAYPTICSFAASRPHLLLQRPHFTMLFVRVRHQDEKYSKRFLKFGPGEVFLSQVMLLWGFQWKRYKRWSSVCRLCGVENK